jgi:hypothetical protein
LRTAPRSSIGPARPRRSIVGVALGSMKCVQTVLWASTSGRCSTSATRAPRWAYRRAAVHPPMLAPTTTTSKSRRLIARAGA